MAKHNSDEMEYIPEWDDGTYQTGAIKAPRASSGLVAFLLLVVIFLGGICSLLGILNIRLLAQLSHKPDETLPMDMASQPPRDETSSMLEQLEDPAPVVPENLMPQLHIGDSPWFSPDKGGILTASQIWELNTASIVDVQCLTHFGATVSGTGLVLSADGLILANSHVVDAAKRVFVTLSDGSMVRAALVGSDSFSDLAVLYIPRQDLMPALFSTNKTLQVTEPVFAVGTQGHVMESTVFSVARTFSTKSHSLNLIQTCVGGDTGPVFNSYGYVIGFQVGSISQYFGTNSVKGTGLVIPTSAIRQIVATLVSHGQVSGRPSIGVEVEAISKLYQQYWQLPGGLLLTGVEEGSAAAACGLQEGDILLALDGNPIDSRSDMYAALYSCQVGDTVVAVVSRDNQKFTVKLTIEENKQDEHVDS